jgi:peptidoglycan hydrolase-like protein with peptidoglycan-binding domain
VITQPPAVVAFTSGQPIVESPIVNLAVAPPTSARKNEKKELQQALKDKGFYKGPVDGDIGPKTKAAIKAFKIANGLLANSIVGPKVKKLLGLK